MIALLLFCLSPQAKAQVQTSTPQLLKERASWTFERFTLPPVFAPGFPYKGVEELRFAPGMFTKGAADYFTYVFTAQLDIVKSITSNTIQDYLARYFKGLCAATARDRKLAVDTTLVTVNELKKITPAIYSTQLQVFGVFADGAPVKLNMEIKVIYQPKSIKTYLLFITSPQPKTNAVWKQLHQIQQAFTLPVL